MMVSEDDILQVNEKILKFFNNEKENIPVYQKIVSILIWNCLNNNIPYGITSEKDRIEALSSYYEAHPFPDKKVPKEEYTYREYKNMFEFVIDLHEYITQIDFTETMFRLSSESIIDVYEDFLKKPKKSSFIGKNEEKDNKIVFDSVIKYNSIFQGLKEKTNIVLSQKMDYYFKKYIKNKFKTTYKQFNPFDEKTLEVSYKEAKKNINKKKAFCKCFEKTEDSNGNVMCKNCGNIYNDIEDTVNYNDYSRVNIVQRYHYEKKCHFRDTINQYQGKQNRYIPEKVYEDIKYMINMHGLSLEKLTINHIKEFLKETSNFKYYEDKQLIFSNIVGKNKPDISKYEKMLYEDFDKLVTVFLKIKDKRKNFLNSHYVLRQLLLKQGVKIPDDHLNSLSTPARLREHDEFYEKCCDILGWNFIPLA
jgi:hypothetical protein